jgi:hypothetical protein
MKVGRELDAEVAVKIMGWTPHPEQMHPTDNRTIGGVLYCPPGHPRDTGRLNVVPCYSTEIEPAMEVVNAMRQRGYRWKAETPHGTGWQIQCFSKSAIWRGETFRGLLPEAICRAALSAIEQS